MSEFTTGPYPASLAETKGDREMLFKLWRKEASQAGLSPAGDPEVVAAPSPPMPPVEPVSSGDTLVADDDVLAHLVADMAFVNVTGAVTRSKPLPTFVPPQELVAKAAEALYTSTAPPKGPTWSQVSHAVRNRFAHMALSIIVSTSDQMLVAMLDYLDEHKIDPELTAQVIAGVRSRLQPRLDARQ